jgi:large conductance mechanosensitive channel
MFTGLRQMLTGYRKFIMRGNVLDLAVAVVMGGAFGAVVTAMVKNVVTPLVAAVAGKPNFSAISLKINNSEILIGDFLNELVSFLLIAAALYFFIVMPFNAITGRDPGEAPSGLDEKKFRDEIRDDRKAEKRRSADRERT